MLKSVEGIFKDGRVTLLEQPPQAGESRVLVTFLASPAPVDLRARGIDEAGAADLRSRLRAFEEDWNRPEMDVYDFADINGGPQPNHTGRRGRR